MAKLNSRLGYEIKRNELALTNMMKNYDGRQLFAKRLEKVIIISPGSNILHWQGGSVLCSFSLEENDSWYFFQDVSTAEASTTTVSVSPLSPPSSTSSPTVLNRIEEETDWEEGCETEEDESDDEELRAPQRSSELPYPVLAPPEQFQNCLSPSATYESGGMRQSVASPAYSNDSVSSALSCSTSTEKSVRFSDRDHILSTPEPRPPSAWWRNLQKPTEHRSEEGAAERHAVKVKSILKPEPAYSKNYVGGVASSDVASFLLDLEDGTLVWHNIPSQGASKHHIPASSVASGSPGCVVRLNTISMHLSRSDWEIT